MANVLAIGYPDEHTAARAAERLERRCENLRIAPDSVAVIARDSQGGYRVTTHHRAAPDGLSWGMFWELLFALIFYVPVFGLAVGSALGGLLGNIERCGINRAFQQHVRDMVEPGTSALFLMADSATAETALAALGEPGGTTTMSSLTEEQEARLLEALHGSMSATTA